MVIKLTDTQRLLAAKFGLTEEQYGQALLTLEKYERAPKTKPLNRCDDAFLNWLSEAYAKLPRGKDFPASDEFMYEMWTACWRCAYSTGFSDGRKNEMSHWKVADKLRNLRPIFLTRKPEWQYLTDDEVLQFCIEAGFGPGSVRFGRIVQAIEAKLKEKNK